MWRAPPYPSNASPQAIVCCGDGIPFADGAGAVRTDCPRVDDGQRQSVAPTSSHSWNCGPVIRDPLSAHEPGDCGVMLPIRPETGRLAVPWVSPRARPGRMSRRTDGAVRKKKEVRLAIAGGARHCCFALRQRVVPAIARSGLGFFAERILPGFRSAYAGRREDRNSQQGQRDVSHVHPLRCGGTDGAMAAFHSTGCAMRQQTNK